MKETFYFPHDYNAHEDEKILKLMSVLGWEGYGLYWGLIEKLASSSEAKIKLTDLEFIAFGMRTQCERITSVVRDYNLFTTDDECFWSNRLVSFFQQKEAKSEKAKESAKVRWDLEANKNANASKNDAIKERKEKERKESKDTYGKFQNVKLLKEEYQKLIEKFGEVNGKERIEILSEYVASKGKVYSSHYATILSWARKDPIKQEAHAEKDYDLRKIKL